MSENLSSGTENTTRSLEELQKAAMVTDPNAPDNTRGSRQAERENPRKD